MDIEEEFRKIRRLWRKQLRDEYERKYGISEHDLEEMMPIAFLKTVKRYDPDVPFMAQFRRKMSDLIYRHFRKMERHQRHTFDGSNVLWELITEDWNRDSVTTTAAVDMSLDRQLILDDMMERMTNRQYEIVRLFKDGLTLRQICAIIGVSESTVSRDISKMAALYDAARFGDIRQYL